MRVLLSTSVFIAHFFTKNTEIKQTKNNDIYSFVNIDSIPSATNSANIIVSGSVFNINHITFYLNGKKIKEVTLKSSDNFSEEIDNLKEGDNEIFVRGKTIDGKTIKESKKFNVFYKKNKPKIEIKEPVDGDKTSQPEITIKGSTEKETFIKINDLPIVVDALGNFETVFRLKEGENKIKIVAEDQAGNQNEKIITVFYQP